MIRVVAFDLDDTLWDVDPVIRRAESQLARWLTETVPGLAYNSNSLGAARESVLAKQPELHQRVTSFRYEVLKTLLLDHGAQESDAHALASEAMEVFLIHRNRIEFFEGAIEALSHAAARYTLGALTNGNADIERLGLENHFSFAFSAEDVGAAKPAPDIFITALEHTGCEPHEMVYVGDDPVKDVDAANAVGLKTIWVKNERRPGPGTTKPDLTIDHVRELPRALVALDNL